LTNGTIIDDSIADIGLLFVLRLLLLLLLNSPPKNESLIYKDFPTHPFMNDPNIEVADVSDVVSKGETGGVLVVEVAVLAVALAVASALPCPSICCSRLLLLPCKAVILVVLLVMTDDAAAKIVALGVEDVDFDEVDEVDVVEA
jgi:hypothetical protein